MHHLLEHANQTSMWFTYELRVRLASLETGLSPPVIYFYWRFQGVTSFVDHLCYLCLVFCHAFASVHCCLVITCWERADLLALVCDFCVFVFVTFPCGILGQVWYLIVSIPDLCRISYFLDQQQKSPVIIKCRCFFQYVQMSCMRRYYTYPP